MFYRQYVLEIGSYSHSWVYVLELGCISAQKQYNHRYNIFKFKHVYYIKRIKMVLQPLFRKHKPAATFAGL